MHENVNNLRQNHNWILKSNHIGFPIGTRVISMGLFLPQIKQK